MGHFSDTCLRCGQTRTFSVWGEAMQLCRCQIGSQGFDPKRVRYVPGTGPKKPKAPKGASPKPVAVDPAPRRRRCPFCHQGYSTTNPPTRDHIVPRSKGGTGASSNLLTVCQLCNRARGDAPWDEYVLAVIAAWADALERGGRYRRPKLYYLPSGGYMISHMTKAERRALAI